MPFLHDIGIDLKNQVLTPPVLIGASVVASAAYLIWEAYRTNFPKIKGLPEVPGALPFVGHLPQLGARQKKNDGTVFTEWSKQVKAPLYQCRLGDQRTVVACDYKTIEDLWIGHTNDLIDRPHQPGFLDTLGVDITSTPMTPQIRKCRAAGMKALAKPAWPKYYPLIEPSSASAIEDLYVKGLNGKKSLDCYYHLRNFVFDLCLSLTYGARFGEVDNEFMLTFLKSINDISAVRGSTQRYRDFVPILRLIPEGTTKTVAAERIRSKHVDVLYKAYLDRVEAGETVDCIVASLGKDKLTLDEIHGTCISLLQAAPDTVASGLYQAVAWLSSSKQGLATQKAAYDAILEAYDGDRDLAWKNAFREEKVPLITSIYKETLRFYTHVPYSVPRRTAREIRYGDVVIPKGITIIMDSQEANHDTQRFGADAWEYKPDRYVGSEQSLPHLAFGAGSRICPAVAISNRLMYAMITRLVLAFEMADDPAAQTPNLDPVEYSDAYGMLVAQPRNYDCKFTARDEEWLKRMVAGK